MTRDRLARIAIASTLMWAGLVCQGPSASATVPAASGVVPVAAGDGFACVTTATGGVQCWGANDHGQLGDGSGIAQSSAVDVAGLSGVVAIAAGGSHACALTSDGVVDCWGLNLDGEIGDGTLTDEFEPVSVLSNAVAIAVGSAHTCALTNAGGVKCWGANLDGQLGDGNTSARLTPVDVSGTTSGVIAITAGGAHSCALTMVGGIKCWGRNDRGQLGDGTTTNRVTPVFEGGFTAGPVGEVTAGGEHTCELFYENGEVACWGANDSGQLGDNSTTDSLTPQLAIASGAAAISAGASHTCALLTTGALQCWGAGGLVGDGTAVQRNAPVAVVGISSGVGAVAAGGDVSCEVQYARTKCWGAGSAVGDPNVASTPDVSVPTDVLSASSVDYQSISPAETHSCAVTAVQNAKCWGDNTDGELGDGTTTSRSAAEDVTGLTGVSSVSAGAGSSCALTFSGAAKCWGDNSTGELGDGTTSSRLVPADVTGLTSGVTQISTGTDSSLVPGLRHACAVVSGAAECWGANTFGELGNSSNVDADTPVAVTGLGTGVTAVAAGGAFSCAIVNGGAKCWGLDDLGQLGSPNTQVCGFAPCSWTPQPVTGLSSGVSQIAVGADHACALTTAGAVKCWGNNDFGQLGDTTMNDRGTPVNVFDFSSGATAIALGDNHSCALSVNSALYCWGAGSSGQLGNGHDTDNPTPEPETAAFTVASIAAGGDTSCAKMSDTSSRCWGLNSSGQVGDGTTTNELSPVPVLGNVPIAYPSSSPPPIVVGTPANGSVSLAWAMPSDIGEGAPTDYQVTVYNSTGDAPTGVTGPTTRMVGSNDPAFTFTGLTNGVGYRFTVAGIATGFPTWPSPLSAVLTPRTLPSAPTAVGAAAGNRQAVVHWTAPATNGGLAIAGYRVTVFNSTGGAATGVTGGTARLVGATPTTLTFTGLTDNTAYRFQVEALTGAGFGPASVLSAAVTPFVTLATAGGAGHSCAILPSTGVQCWGQNNAGQVGDGTTLTRLTPVNVSTLASGVTAIADGASHSCARLSTGAVKCWGLNTSGQLGDATTTNRHAPVAVSGLTSGVTAIATGGSHTCALLTGGTVKCWGLNTSGQLGDGTTTLRTTPVAVSGLTGVTAIAAGGSFTCARLSTGAVKCWGLNSSGQLGDGTITLRKTPVGVSGLASGVTAITAGTSHTCARLSTGAVKCWGLNSSGQLGDGTIILRKTPVAVSGLTTATAVSAGAAHTCALLTNATVKCWGLNSSGQLGDGTTVLRKTPVAVTGLTTVGSIALGSNHTTARLTTGAPRTWGANANGQLGSGTTSNRATAGTVVGLT